MNAFRLAIIGLFLFAVQPCPAATTQWGVSALTTYADCSLFVCDSIALASLTPIITSTQSGGLNQTAAAELDVPQVHDTFDAGTVDMGITSAQIDLDPLSLNVPVVKAKAASNSLNGWVGALAFGLQGYQYTGGSATTINLDAALSGLISNDAPDILDTTALSAGVWLIRVDPGVVFPNPPPMSVGELAAFVATLPVEDFWLDEQNATGNVSLGTGGDPVSILVNPNEEFFLMAALAAGASGAGHSADAFGTLTMQFDTSNLIAAGGTVVPLPAAVWLFGSALLVIGRYRRHGAHA